MKPAAVKKFGAGTLDDAIASCRRVRLAFDQLVGSRSEIADRLRAATARLARAETAVATARGQANALALTGKAVPADLISAAEAELVAAQTELREATEANVAVPAAIELLSTDLDEQHAALSAAVISATAGIRAKAEALHRQGLQCLRDAFAAVALLDGNHAGRGVEITDLRGGYDTAWRATKVSSDMAAALEEIGPAVQERNAALRRLLR